MAGKGLGKGSKSTASGSKQPRTGTQVYRVKTSTRDGVIRVQEVKSGPGKTPARVGERALKSRDTLASQFHEALLKRVNNELAVLVTRASPATLARALEQPTAFGSLVETIAGSVYADPEITDDDRTLQAALARGAGYKKELLKRAGGAYTAQQLGDALGITRQAIHEGRSRNLYFGVPAAEGIVFPKLQLTSKGLLPGLREFLGGFEMQDPWTQLMVLIEPNERLDSRSPLQALRSGDIAGAVRVAATYGEHGA